MNLTVFNGSPKRGANNTAVLIDTFIQGYTKNNAEHVIVCKLSDVKTIDKAVQLFKQADSVVIAFPLYGYAMPSGVKEFFEALELLCNTCRNKKLGFIIQYGFPEAVHARPLEKYLEYVTSLLGCSYLGTIIKGGTDGLARSPKRYKKILKAVYAIGSTFGTSGAFDKTLIERLAKPEHLGLGTKILMRLMVPVINKYYWTAQLKKNGAIDTCFARPYA